MIGTIASNSSNANNNKPTVPPLVLRVQDELENLLRKELGVACGSSKSRSYAFFRISYLRAVSQLRPTFFDDMEDFLDPDLRTKEWGKRQRFNQLKAVWIRYDKVAPDKARNLGAEDQEIENDLDMIEEEIQEEWQEFCEELLDMLDEEYEDFEDEEDLDDLDEWRGERKRMRQDASLLKRRILERTMQRRAREEEDQKRMNQKEEEKRIEDLAERAFRAASSAALHAAALEAASPSRKNKQKVRRGFDGNYSSPSLLSLKGDEDESDVHSSQKSKHRRAHGFDGNASSPTLLKVDKDKTDKSRPRKSKNKKARDFDGNYSSPSLLDWKVDEDETPLASSSKHKTKKKLSSKKSKSDGSINDDEKESEHDNKKKKKKTRKEPKHPDAPKTPQVKRRTTGHRSSVNLVCPKIDETEYESPLKSRVNEMPSRHTNLAAAPVLDDLEPDLEASLVFKSEPIPRKESNPPDQDLLLQNSSGSVSSLRDMFSGSTAPTPSMHRSLSKMTYTPNSSFVESYSKPDSNASKKASQNLKGILKVLEMHDSEMLSTEELVKALNDLLELVRDDEGTRADFVGGKGNSFLHAILDRFHQKDLSVTEACLRALIPLLEHDKNRDALAQLGAIETAMVGILFHKESPQIQQYGCDVLRGFAADRKYQDWIVASNGMQVLLKVQSSFLPNAGVQTACFRCIAQIVLDHKENSRHFAADGGIKHIMGVVNMAEHESCVELHRAALCALSVLAKDEVNRGSIAKQEGVYVVLWCMESFADDAELVGYACRALCALATDHSQNCKTIFDQDGLRIVFKAMKDHFMHESVQEGALGLLRQMTENDQISKKFAEIGGIDRVLTAMRNFETMKIQEQGCLTLCNMSSQDENKETIRNLGGIRMIVSAMRLLSKSAFVQKSACRALDSMAQNDQSKVTIAASGGVSAMLSAMKNHESAAGVLALAITALRKVATITRNRNIMKTNDGIDTIEKAMKRYPNHTHLVENGKALVKLLDPTRALSQAGPAKESSPRSTKESIATVTEAANAADSKVVPAAEEMGPAPDSASPAETKELQKGVAATDAPGFLASQMLSS